MSFKNRVNVYRCERCHDATITIDVDEGVTPMFLDCRAKPGCGGRAVSLFYPPPSVLAGLPPPAWEWYRPGDGALRRLKRRDPELAEHVERGGLLIRERKS